MATTVYCEGERKTELSKKYQWVFDEFHRAFPNSEIIKKEFDWGTAIVIGIKNGNKFHSFLLEGLRSIEGIPYKTKIVGLPNSKNPKETVYDMIEKVKKIFN